MMKLLIPFFLLFNFLSNPDIEEIRKIYPNASKSENASKEFTAKIASVSNDNDKTLWAYKGASLTLTAKFANNIPDKISNLKDGSKMIDAAVSSEPSNIEIRLIRLSVQENVPKIVNYRKNKTEDKAFILAHYKEQSVALKEYVKNFILLSKSFTASEKKSVKIIPMEEISETDWIRKKKVCVIVPTYNNSKTLKRVLDSILVYTSDIILVNDGSTDGTAQIAKQYTLITQIHLPKNSGKGIALRNGFKKAIELQFDYAITIDSDGQHFPSDIPKFINALEIEPEALLIGSRNMTTDDIPKKSSFGNAFSNFWFWFETGIRLEDTQSGYRLYPLKRVPKKYVTSKFEFEIEVIVRSAWKGISVKNIPIQILYDPSERVTHFRPFKDFTRISILNTVLVLITLFYIKPRDFFRSLKKKGFKKFFLENILESNDSNSKKAGAIALGVFIGIAPFWGFQTIIVLFLAVLLKSNKAIAFAFSNISFPPFIPFIIYGSIQMGSFFIHNDAPLLLDQSLSFSDIHNHIAQYLVGSFILAALLSIIFGLTGYLFLTIFSTFRNK